MFSFLSLWQIAQNATNLITKTAQPQLTNAKNASHLAPSNLHHKTTAKQSYLLTAEQPTKNELGKKATYTIPEYKTKKQRKNTPGQNDNLFTESVRFAALALLIVIPIRVFIAQPFIVSGASMTDTFHNGDYLIVDQLSYRFEDPERGDVVIFRYPRNPSKFFIKRVIGMPGDTIAIDGTTVTLTNEQYPNGRVLEESYITSMQPSNPMETSLGDGEYFVMGDNRNESSDSRVWGVLSEDRIIGQAFLRLFPLADMSYLPGDEPIPPITSSP